MNKGQNIPVLEARNLSVSFRMYDGTFKQKELRVISDLSIQVFSGEILAIAGSSGSGKSLLASAILGILPRTAAVRGELRYHGQTLTPKLQKQLRGTKIALVPQSVDFLDPLMRAGAQADGHRKPYPTQRRRRLFARFGLPDDTERCYPFQLSGGMARRVLVSTALLADAQLMIADEPTPGMSLGQTHCVILTAGRFGVLCHKMILNRSRVFSPMPAIFPKGVCLRQGAAKVRQSVHRKRRL